MEYSFDTALDRRGTYSMKYDDELYFRRMAPNIRLDDDTIRLLLADLDFPCAPAITRAMHRVADFGTFGYTTSDADPEFRGSIVRWYQRRHDLALESEWIVYSAGALDGVARAIEAFSAPGDGVLICCPVYSNFASTIRRLGRVVVNCELLQSEPGDYRMDWERFEQLAAAPENKVYVLCSPENPVGRVWEPGELSRMAQICREHDVVLVSDEIHSDIVRAGVRHTPILAAAGDDSNIVMISGVNKSFNLMGLHGAYSVISNDDLRARFKEGYHAALPTPFALAATIAAYDESEDWLDALNAYLDDTIAALVARIGERLPRARAYVPEGTYILWVDFGAYEFPDGVLQYLTNHKANVAVQGGLSHDPEQGGSYLRLCVTGPKAVMLEAIDRMAEAFAAYGAR